MRKASLTLLIAATVLSAIAVRASGPVAVYTMIEKVVMEPDDSAPQRIQIWGVFSLKTPGDNAMEYGAVQQGYLYYKIDPALCPNNAAKSCMSDIEKTTRAIWSDLKKKAGKNEAVGFGGDWPFGARLQLARVRKAADKPESPDPFPLGNSVITLGASQTDVVARLKAALPKK